MKRAAQAPGEGVVAAQAPPAWRREQHFLLFVCISSPSVPGSSALKTAKVDDVTSFPPRQWRIQQRSGFPSAGINRLLLPRGRAVDDPQTTRDPHRDTATFGTVGFAELVGPGSVDAAVSRPGVIHLSNGVYDAPLDQGLVAPMAGQIGLVDTKDVR